MLRDGDLIQRLAGADGHTADRIAALRADASVRLIDTFAEQLDELAEVRAPDKAPSDRSPVDAVDANGVPRDVWIHYPWQRVAVRVLREPEFHEVRTSRNQLRIQRHEQVRLRQLRIGVVGLSVGRAAALTLALEGIGGLFRLADFDTLALSNLNRVHAPLWELGENKAVACARELLAIDPYLRIDILPAGVDEESLDTLLGEGDGKLDVLVEECDDLAMKLRLREAARERGIAVIMATSERGLLDVERFDNDPNRPLFHGRVGDLRAESLAGLSKADKVPVVLRILGEDNLSDRTVASLLEIESTLVTWPQLASAVALGGATVADTVRRMYVDGFADSGRYSVDFTTHVSPEHRHATPLLNTDPSVPTAGRSNAPLQSGRLDRNAVRRLAEAVGHAPSGGNLQPWRLLWRDGCLEARLDPSRSSPFLDFGGEGTRLGFGAAAENLALRAAQIGCRADIDVYPDPSEPDLLFRARVRVSAGAVVEKLAEAIPMRCTNRRRTARVPLPSGVMGAMSTAASASGGTILWRDDPETIERLAQVLARTDRLRLLHPVLHDELMAELRWTPAEARETADGLDIATLELSPGETAALRLMRRHAAMQVLARLGAGRELGRLSVKAMRGASAVGLVCVPQAGAHTFFNGGRAVQRAWLQAALDGVQFQPMSAVTYMWLRTAAGGDGLNPTERAEYAKTRQIFDEIWQIPADLRDVMMFRVFVADAPSVRSLRRPIDDFLTFDVPTVASKL